MKTTQTQTLRRIGELLSYRGALDRVITQRRGRAVLPEEQPIDCHPTHELVAELIRRALESNGLDFVPTPAKIQLAHLLLYSVVGEDN